MTHDVFICHASEDRTIANAICSHLERNRIRCWIAPRDVVPGSDYAQSIVEAIAGSKITLLVFSHSSNHSPHVKREIERSVSHGIPILPFRVEDAVPSPSLEYFISDAHWLDAVTPPMEEHLAYLAGTVRMLLDRESAAGTAAGEVAAGAMSPPGGTWAVAPVAAVPPPEVPASSPGPSRPRWVVPAAVAALVVAIAGVVGVVIALGGDDDGGAPLASPAASEPGTRAKESEPVPDEPDSPADGEVVNPVSEFFDQFSGPLDSDWVWENEDPEAWRLSEGWLELDALPSPPIRNMLLRDAPSDSYTIHTRLHFRPTTDFQFAGIVLTGSDPQQDFLQFGRAYCDDVVCVGDGLYLDRFEDGMLVGENHATTIEPVETIYLTLDVNDGMATAFYSYDGERDWQVVGTEPWELGGMRIGLVAHQAPTPITASFDYVVLTRW
ncbi:MAG: TIR domain-containing protein [Actinomycetota bacterium]